MTITRDWQVEVSGLLTGEGTPYRLQQFNHEKSEVEVQDQRHPRADGRRFGRDFLDGMVLNLEYLVKGETAAEVLDNLAALRRVWQADDVRRVPGATSVLAYRRPGQPTRRVFGRPRRFTPATLGNAEVGSIPVVADFQCADHLFYSDGVNNLSISGVAIQFRTVENLVTNPSFEVDTAGWAPGSFTAIARSTAVAWVGAASLQMVQDGAESTLRATYSTVTVVPGTDYTAQARFFSGTGSHTCQVEFEWFDAGSASLGVDTSAGVVNTAGLWVQESLTAAAPAGAATATLTLIVIDSAGAIYNADAAMVTEGDLLLDYGDGDQPGWFWTGTAHASTSKRLSGGVIPPVIPPVTLAEAVVESTLVTNAGDTDTWPVYVIQGPRHRPRVIHVGTEVEFWLDITLARDQSVTVDPRPWARSVLRSDGANLAGSMRGTRLSAITLPPGGTEIAFRGDDDSGLSNLTVQWRDADKSL